MKRSLATLAACLTLALVGHAQQGPEAGPNGKPGVEDGTCWRNAKGNAIKVKVKGTLHGDQKVTVLEGGKSGKGKGTPDPDGGCAESSNIKVGAAVFKAKSGSMKYRNSSGKWVKMFEVTCPKEADDQ